jgi:starch synthase (maltosyl-transferring)
MRLLGLPWNGRYDVVDLLTGERFNWGEHNYVRLDPQARVPAHVFQVQR